MDVTSDTGKMPDCDGTTEGRDGTNGLLRELIMRTVGGTTCSVLDRYAIQRVYSDKYMSVLSGENSKAPVFRWSLGEIPPVHPFLLTMPTISRSDASLEPANR